MKNQNLYLWLQPFPLIYFYIFHDFGLYMLYSLSHNKIIEFLAYCVNTVAISKTKLTISIVCTFYRRQLNLKIIPFDDICQPPKKGFSNKRVNRHGLNPAASTPYLTGKNQFKWVWMGKKPVSLIRGRGWGWSNSLHLCPPHPSHLF